MSRPDGYLLSTIDVSKILEEVARGFNISVDELVGRSRAKEVVVARACAMAVIREGTKLSYPAIGRLFDRDHTTVMHHVARVMGDATLAKSVRLAIDELSPAPQLFSVEAG